jgi:hypothetical protein
LGFILGSSNDDGAFMWIKNYCEENPLEKLAKPMVPKRKTPRPISIDQS